MDTTDPADTLAADKLHRQQARRARWSKIGGGLLLATVVIRGGVALLKPAEAQDCDATEVRSALIELVNGAVVKSGAHATVTTLDRLTTVNDDSKLRRCTGHVVLSDKSDGKLTYHVDPKTVMIDTLD